MAYGAIRLGYNARARIGRIVKAQRERCKTLVEMAAASIYFYQDFAAYDEKAVAKNFKADTDEVLQALHDEFAQLPEWESESLHQVVLDIAEGLQLNLGKVAQPLRVALCGSAVSPAIDQTLALLGREKTLPRLQRAIHKIKNLN